MPAATILIPTHNHVLSLYHSVAGAQAQTLQDFELFIIGDGVTDATRDVVFDLAKTDGRIRFFDFPKGPRKGEIHRHEALRQARGRFIAYLGDDDFWLPDHLQTLGDLLVDVDFGNTLHIGVTAERELYVKPAHMENPRFRRRMLTTVTSGFDFTVAGHTLAAYRRLPFGWRTTPPYFPATDLYMWRQFLVQPWCKARSAIVPTCICTQTHRRPNMSDRERADDLAYWRDEAAKPEFPERLWRLADESLVQDLSDRPASSAQMIQFMLERLRYSKFLYPIVQVRDRLFRR